MCHGRQSTFKTATFRSQNLRILQVVPHDCASLREAEKSVLKGDPAK